MQSLPAVDSKLQWQTTHSAAYNRPSFQAQVLLDAAAFVPTHRLNLREVPAEFVGLSFYKLFDYPTGIGALILRRENIPLLRQSYWGVGQRGGGYVRAGLAPQARAAFWVRARHGCLFGHPGPEAWNLYCYVPCSFPKLAGCRRNNFSTAVPYWLRLLTAWPA